MRFFCILSFSSQKNERFLKKKSGEMFHAADGVEPGGFEPPTCCQRANCSTELSYGSEGKKILHRTEKAVKT